MNSAMKRLLIAACMLVLIVALFAVSAYACTTIYVGGNLAAAGAPIVARSEDYINSASKLMYISPHGQYRAGDKYVYSPHLVAENTLLRRQFGPEFAVYAFLYRAVVYQIRLKVLGVDVQSLFVYV